MDKQEYFSDFASGARNLFFIVTKDYADVLKKDNMFFYMNRDNGLSVVGFVTHEEAEHFHRSVFSADSGWKIVSLNSKVFDAFLDSLDPDFREKLVFELI